MAGQTKPIFWVPLLFGLMTLTSVLTRPSVATYRAVDVITMVMGGVLLGIGIAQVVQLLRERRRPADTAAKNV